MRKRITRAVWLGFALLYSVSIAAQRPSEPETLVEGTVKNGVGGVSLEGVRVSLTPRSGLAVTKDTDEGGRFSFGGLNPGEYTIKLSKVGFFTPVAAEPLVTVISGQPTRNLSLVLIPKSAIEGQILDDTGQPVRRATVVILSLRYDGGRKTLLPPGANAAWFPGRVNSTFNGADVVTDESGRYRLFNLDPGTYYIGVWRELDRGGAGNVVPGQYYPGVTDPADAATVVLQPGNDLHGIDIRLAPSPTRRFGFKIQGNSECRVKGAASTFQLIRRSRNGITVTEGLRTSPSDQPGPGPTRREEATENTFQLVDGVWMSPEISEGSYDFYYSSCYLFLHGPVDSGHLHLEIGNKDLEVMNMELKPSAPFRAHLTIAPAVASALGTTRPMAKFFDLDQRSPFLLPAQGGQSGSPPFLPTAAGDIEFPYLAVGRYTFNLSRLPDDAYVSSVIRDGLEVRDAGLIHDGQAHDIRIFVDSPGGIIDGVVNDRLGKPVDRTQVVLFPSLNQRQNRALFKITTTDRAGRFSIRGIAPGEYGVVALAELEPEAHFNEDFLRSVESSARKIMVQRGSAEHLTLMESRN